ncbi:MAG: flagellar biosynthesis anti-sigma factor FlgM [Lachnospiraceae bacterium]|uniref:flagellar biosynthesis anti-sigma factor FlgM n=1 Tax=Candidatus Merdisoma sp. JLR.KK006 TaxID=3112626 RepID=UPI002FF27739|nr:flagellar biosynthesis anti-sigma factor FlgM [Lachnospiraceae bacterium]
MKISLNNISPYRMEATGHTRTDGKVSGGTKGNGNYDALTIQSSSRQIQEKTFSEALSKQVVSESGQGASADKVEAIKQQVEAGTYQIDPYMIAARMLVSGEAFAHA